MVPYYGREAYNIGTNLAFDITMNRKKKIFTKLKAKDKKAKSKLAPKKKDRYISKAERAKMDAIGDQSDIVEPAQQD